MNKYANVYWDKLKEMLSKYIHSMDDPSKQGPHMFRVPSPEEVVAKAQATDATKIGPEAVKFMGKMPITE